MNRSIPFSILFIFVITLLGNNISESVYFYIEDDSTFESPFDIADSEFQENSGLLVSLGFQKNSAWVKIPINDSMQGKSLVIDCSKFSFINCYIPDTSGALSPIPWSRAKHNPGRELYPSFAIPESVQPGSSIYLHFSSQFKIRFRVKVMDTVSLRLHDKQSVFFIGILLGTLIALLLYNIFISAYLHDKSYFLYVFYILSFTFYEIAISGVGALFGISLINAIVPSIIITLLSAGFFSISYLQLRSYTRRGYWLMARGIIPVGLIFLVFSLLSPSTMVTPALNNYILVGILLIVLNGIITAKRGNRTAHPYLLAWSILFICGIIFISRDTLGLPHNIITNNLVLIGGSLTSMILSLGLAQHIRDIQHERELMSRREENLTEMAQTDALTGLYNKRYFEINVGAMLQNRATPLSLAVLDIDHFKKYNDTYGHLEGDTVLRVIGELLYDNIEESDIPIRYGGEEFVIIMPDTPLEEARQRCEQIRKSTEDLHFVLAKGSISRVTISMGVAEAGENEGENQLFIRADKALYEAKELGRNRVVTANHDEI